MVEVFCPPWFVPAVEKIGLKGLSLDTCTGWNLDDPKTQEWVLSETKEHPPELMVICPACTDAGGWFHLNSLTMPIQEVLRRKLLLKRQRAFCKKLIRQQLEAGGRVLFQHPSPSCYWEDPDFAQWCEERHSFVTHMCCFNLHVPAHHDHSKKLIRKSTRLLCSHADMCVLRRSCPGASDPQHGEHRQVAGSEPGLESVSRHAGKYTPEFVRAVLDTVPRFGQSSEVLECSFDCCVMPSQNLFEALAAQEQVDPGKIKESLMKLHRNLGHPRKVNTVTEFNRGVGLDVKFLPGWKPNQRIAALNAVDHATSYQLMLPFFETETSSVLRKLYLERWVQWAGSPREVIVDQARTNLGKAMVEPTELEDLLNEPQPVIPNNTSLHDDAIARSYALRTTAREAVLELQDDRTLRRAMLARPRREKPFASGDIVAYWRDQKWNQGLVSKGGRWYGSGVVLGLIGRNVVIAHRNHILRCAPEQLRLATPEEKALVETQGTELLGVKDMIEGGTFRSSRYVDLLSQSYPPQEQEVVQPGPDVDVSTLPDPTGVFMPSQLPATSEPHAEMPRPFAPANVAEEPKPEVSSEAAEQNSGPSSSARGPDGDVSMPEDASSTYGPMRRSRILAKSGPFTMFRPAAMKHDEFVEVMNEVVPQLIEPMVQSNHDASGSDRKRKAAGPAEEPVPKLPKTEGLAAYVEHAIPYVEAASCSASESNDLWGSFRNTQENAVEVFSNQYYNKRAQKEIPASRNDPFLQAKGHLDPDLSTKASSGQLQSPTLSQMGRTVLFQLMPTFCWQLQLGDVKGAFLEAGPLPSCYRPLYARIPAGGIPGTDEESLIEILGNVYGQNDAPAAWYKVFNDEVLKAGFERSKFDNCLYWMKEDGKLVGALGAHVDNTATGGSGDKYNKALAYLRQRFPYRKWRLNEGSTLAAEAQAMVAATGTLEWTSLLLAEAIEGIGDIRDYDRHLKARTPEKVRLQDLLTRAGIPPGEVEPSTPGSFSVIEPTSMTNASKRRPDDFEDEPSFKRSFADDVPYAAEGPPQPVLVGQTHLPHHVPTVHSWGRSIIQFGKFAVKRDETGISYSELYEDRVGSEKVRYVKWVISQTDSAKGLLLDLASYLCVRSAIQRRVHHCLHGHMAQSTGTFSRVARRNGVTKCRSSLTWRQVVPLVRDDDRGGGTAKRPSVNHPKAFPCLRELPLRESETGRALTAWSMSLLALVQAKVDACPLYRLLMQRALQRNNNLNLIFLSR
eukprot:s645_g15.t1